MPTILSKIERAQEILGYRFKDLELLKSAITHPSAVEGKPVSAGYERLEFLGDSVVGFIVSEELYERFPEMDEGGLTRLKVSLISGESLSAAAAERGFADIIVFGSSERGTGARGLHSALENVYEAVTGAVYLDGGLEPARRWVLDTLQPHLAPWRAALPENPKSLLQEKTQADLCAKRRATSWSPPAARRTARPSCATASWVSARSAAARGRRRRRRRRPRPPWACARSATSRPDARPASSSPTAPGPSRPSR